MTTHFGVKPRKKEGGLELTEDNYIRLNNKDDIKSHSDEELCIC